MVIPRCGVVDKALKPLIPDSVLRFKIWLSLHTHPLGEEIWEKIKAETQNARKEQP